MPRERVSCVRELPKAGAGWLERSVEDRRFSERTSYPGAVLPGASGIGFLPVGDRLTEKGCGFIPTKGATDHPAVRSVTTPIPKSKHG